jgi:hypothetical protein
MQQTPYTLNPANHRMGAKLTATEPTGLLGCDTSRARPVGAVQARSALLWANLTGGMTAHLRAVGGSVAQIPSGIHLVNPVW